MNRYFKGLFTLIVLPLLALLAGCNSDGAFTALESIEITASPMSTKEASQLTLAAGNTQAFTALGRYSDGTSKPLTGLNIADWRASNKNIGFFSAPGVLTAGDTPGVVSVNLVKDGVSSNVLTVNVTSAVITHIEIAASPVKTQGASQLTLARGNTQKFTALGRYSDGTSKPLTGLSVADWRTSDKNMGVFSAPGVFTGGDTAGVVSVNVVKDGVSSNALKVNVTSAIITGISLSSQYDSIAKSQVTQLRAMATYSDSTVVEVSDSVAWELSNPSVADIDATGVLTGKLEGSTEIKATKEGFSSNPVNVTVTAAFITDITLIASKDTVAKGQGLTLVATAIYNDKTTSDITDSVIWRVDNTKAVTTISKGILAGKEAGVVKIKAVKDNVISDELTLTVTDAVITSITLGADKYSLADGQTVSLTAMAIYSDNTSGDITKDVTWTYSDNTIVTIQPDGTLTGESPGKVDITASKDNAMSNKATFTVTTAVITSIMVTSAQNTVVDKESLILTATAIYSNNTSSNVSQTVAWELSKQDIASVQNDVGSSDAILTGKKPGVVNVKAFLDGAYSNEVKITVTSGVVKSLALSTSHDSISVGQTAQLTVIATYDDDSKREVNKKLVNSLHFYFSFNNSIKLTIDNNGIVKGESAGKANVKVKAGAIESNELVIIVTPAVIESIEVKADGDNTTTPIGKAQLFTLTATYSDGSTATPPVADVTWTVSDPQIAINNSNVLRGLRLGEVSMIANYKGLRSESKITVTDAEAESLRIVPIRVVELAKNQKFSMNAGEFYTDGTVRNVTDSVTWLSDNESVVTVDKGQLHAVGVGSAHIKAILPWMTSNEVTVNVCDISGVCKSIYEGTLQGVSGVYFMNSPSVPFFDSIGSISPLQKVIEDGSEGPTGEFYAFTVSQANALCGKYNDSSINNRINWRVPSKDELDELFAVNGNMFSKQSWPASLPYWTQTKVKDNHYNYKNLLNGNEGEAIEYNSYYVSCISTPPSFP
ncbi:Ig-like domain-containing protein [Shewanella sp.]|nr:Ig-like domain-containing protein [Shewanella sp.]